MRKKIRNVLAVAAAIITVLSINPLISMADMPDEPIVIEWINEHGYVYYNNADEAYSAISDYLKDAWPAYEEYNGGVLKSFIREALQIELKVFMIHIAATDCLMT